MFRNFNIRNFEISKYRSFYISSFDAMWGSKNCDCFTGVPNFIWISQAIYELSGFETLKIGHTHTHPLAS